MVAGNNHQRTENYFLVAGFLNLFDHCFACSIFRFTLYSADEHIVISEGIHLVLHLAVTDFCGMRGSVSHEYESSSVFLCSVKAFVACSFYCLCCNCLCNRFFIAVYGIVCRAHFTQKRLGDGYGFKLVAVACNRFAQFVIFCTVHQMSRLYDQILYTVINSTLQCLIHIIDFFTIPCLHMVDDDLCTKCTSYGPVGICFLQCFFDAADILCTAVVKGSAKAYNKQFVFPDLICV